MNTAVIIGITWGEGGKVRHIPPIQYFFNLGIVYLVPELNNEK
jgi:hypothetical protein